MKSLFVIGTIVILLLYACGDTSVETYKPKDQNEADIIALLKKYKSALDNDDMQQFLSCFHKDCQYRNTMREMIGKEEIAKNLPEWFRKWDTVDISIVEIDVKENSATVNTKEKINYHGHETLGLDKKGFTRFNLIRENNQWLILKSSWS